jgi:hypothetical protein
MVMPPDLGTISVLCSALEMLASKSEVVYGLCTQCACLAATKIVNHAQDRQPPHVLSVKACQLAVSSR